MPRAVDPSLHGGGLPITHSPLNRMPTSIDPKFDLLELLEKILGDLANSIPQLIEDVLFPAIKNLTGIDLSALLPLLHILQFDFSSPQAFLMSLWNAVLALPGALIQVFLGLGSSTGIDFTSVSGFFNSILGILQGVFASLFNPLAGFGQIGQVLLNLLPNPTFDTANSIQGFNVFNWVGSIFHDTGGSATVLANGSLREMISDPATPVAPGQVLNISQWVKWTGVNATGAAFKVAINTFSDLKGQVEVAQTTIATISNPAPASSNPSEANFIEMTGTYTVPASGVKAVRMHLIVTENVISGQSWWSDAGLLATQKMQPNFIEDLVEKLFHIDLNGFFDAVGLKNLENIGMIAQTKITGLVDDFKGLIGAVAGIFDGSATLQDIIDRLVNLVGGFFDASWLFNILGIPTIPSTNVAGIGGAFDIGQTIQDTWDFLWSGFNQLFGIGKSPAQLANSAQNVSAAALLAISQAEENSTILAIRNNTPLYVGVDEATESTFLMTDLIGSTDPPNFAVTQSTATMGYIRISQAALKGFVSWFGKGFTSITAAYVDIYKVDTVTGVHTLVHSSNDQSGMIGGSWGYLQYFLPEANRITAIPGDVFGIELRVVGAGTHTIAGKNITWLPTNSLVRPKSLASARNAGTGVAPSTIADGTITYSGNQPWFGFGIVTGDIPPAVYLPREKSFIAAGPYAYDIPSWANVIDVVAVGGGGGGQAGTGALISGDGGSPGTWTSKSLRRGTDFPTAATVLSGVVGNGGHGGSVSVLGENGDPGVATTCNYSSTNLVTAAGGGGGTGFVNPDGAGPGNFSYKGKTYFGGQTTDGPVIDAKSGSAPGGAGPGGQGVFIVGSAGGNGASGSIWFVANQN
jgi:hypothetical protein